MLRILDVSKERKCNGDGTRHPPCRRFNRLRKGGRTGRELAVLYKLDLNEFERYRGIIKKPRSGVQACRLKLSVTG